MTDSRQPRFSHDQIMRVYNLIQKWVEVGNYQAPPYSVNSMPRDQWLREFWQREPLWAGVVKSVTNIDKNRGWTLTGGRNQVAQYTRVLREANNGAGWRRYIGLQSLSYATSNMGAITELGFDTASGNGPLRAIYHLDSARCELTGKIDYPLSYYPDGSGPMGFKQDWFMRAVSMESTDDAMFGLGRCSTDMALDLATIMVAIFNHDKEMLFARMQKGLLFMKSIREDQWETAMQANAERLTAKEREFFAGLSIFFGDDEMDAKLVALSQLWEGFTLQEWVNVMMYGYALIVGYDPSEFWPVNFGALGRGTEAEVQALKATGKGGLDFILAYQDNLQRELPATLLFEFEQRNEQGQILEAEVAKTWAMAINEMAKPAGPGLPETLTVDERRQLLAQRQLIPDDWTLQEEDVVATDTDDTDTDRRKKRNNYIISRAIARSQFTGEPVVRRHWPSGSEVVIYDPAKERARLFAMPTPYQARQETLYKGDGWSITDEDVDLSIAQARQRVDERYGDILEAEVI